MINIFKLLFGSGSDLRKLIDRDAVIVDVRTPAEFKQGHATGAVNIPLAEINNRLDQIQSYQAPIITCCATGRRSGIARRQLKAQGLEAYNGGPWQRVQQYLERPAK